MYINICLNTKKPQTHKESEANTEPKSCFNVNYVIQIRVKVKNHHLGQKQKL